MADEQEIFRTGLPLVNKEQADPDVERYYLTTKVPLNDSRGNVIGLTGVARDIADLKRTEKHQRELALERERVKVLHEFITNISHDLKTPLSIINTCLYVLERLTDPAAQKDKLETIKQQTALLTHFMEEILTSARLESSFIPRRDRVNLSHLLVGVEANLCPEAALKNLTVLKLMQDNVPDVPGDQVELERLLINLVHNAIRYTPPGGSITLKTFALTSHVVVEIADTGIGISQDDLPHIFEHFFRADTARSMEKAGTGLGLAIAKRIVEVHEGTIEVESTPGQGTTFRVSLPVFQPDE
jgi:two-component system phosphate regulon sensor histidine kinase PhoR